MASIHHIPFFALSSPTDNDHHTNCTLWPPLFFNQSGQSSAPSVTCGHFPIINIITLLVLDGFSTTKDHHTIGPWTLCQLITDTSTALYQQPQSLSTDPKLTDVLLAILSTHSPGHHHLLQVPGPLPALSNCLPCTDYTECVLFWGPRALNTSTMYKSQIWTIGQQQQQLPINDQSSTEAEGTTRALSI